MIHLDFETYSDLDLKQVGAYRYAQDPSTEVLCLAYTLDAGKTIKTWIPHQDPRPPKALYDAVRNGELLAAHNAQFERAIWELLMVKQHGAPRTKRSQWRCTAARAASAGLARALDKATNMLGLEHRKDPKGGALLRFFAQPRKPTKKDPSTRNMPAAHPEKFKELVAYCVQDVRAEHGLDVCLPQMHPAEHEVFELDMVINERGIPIDTELVQIAMGVVTQLEKAIAALVAELTGGIRPTQVAKLLAWCQDHGVPLANMKAEAIKMRLAKGVADPVADRVLRLRLEAGKVSTKKLAAMLRCVEIGGNRVRGTLLYHGAGTGRWSGKLVQPHNFIRGNLKVDQQALVLRALAHGDPELMALLWDWPLDVISQVMRSFIMASPGTRLMIADYAAIEARVLAWLANEFEELVAFRKGADVYKRMAAKVFNVSVDNVSPEQRRIGKNLVLGCGYGLGGAKFVEYCANVGVYITEEFSFEAVNAYRDAHKQIQQYWKDCERAFRHAATKRTECNVGPVRFGYVDGWVYIQLPSGRRLYYWDVQVEVLPPRHGKPAFNITYHGDPETPLWDGREKLYGGKIVENIVQAVARDIMVNGMLKAHKAGYNLVSTVHDEVISEQENGKGRMEEYVALLCDLPKWAIGCPVTAEGFETQRYRKG